MPPKTHAARARAARVAFEGTYVSAPAGAFVEESCVLCLSEQVSRAFVPCGHLCVCEQCSSSFGQDRAFYRCPLCQVFIQSSLRIFFAFRRPGPSQNVEPDAQGGHVPSGAGSSSTAQASPASGPAPSSPEQAEQGEARGQRRPHMEEMLWREGDYRRARTLESASWLHSGARIYVIWLVPGFPELAGIHLDTTGREAYRFILECVSGEFRAIRWRGAETLALAITAYHEERLTHGSPARAQLHVW